MKNCIQLRRSVILVLSIGFILPSLFARHSETTPAFLAEESFDCPTILLASFIVDAGCNGGTSGSIDITPVGGTAPYSFLWSSGETTEDLANLGIGIYTVTVTDAENCTRTQSFHVSEESSIQIFPTAIDVTCYNGSDGGIDLIVLGGSGPYEFDWSHGSSSQNQVGLAAGDYSVVVTDAQGCSAITSITIGQPDVIVAIGNPTAASCNGGTDGSINLTVFGGAGGYTYSWSNGATTEDISNLSLGIYTVTVTDMNGCTASTSVAVSEDVSMQLGVQQIPISCNGASDGGIDLTIFGGTAPYSFDWSHGSTTEDQVNLAAGDYTVTVTDATGCGIITQFSLVEPDQLMLSAETIDVAEAQGNSGSIDLSVEGGTSPYSYSWSNGETSEDINGLMAGTYSVTVTDAGGCTAEHSITIMEPAVTVEITSDKDCLIAGPFEVTVSFSHDIVDFGLDDLIISNGTASNLMGSGTSFTATITPVAMGTVTIDISANAVMTGDGASNFAADQFSIGYDPTPFTVTITSPASGMTNGPFDVTVTLNAPTKTLEKSDMTIVNGTITNDEGDADVYTFTLVPIAQGLITIDIAACVAVDDFGSPNIAAEQFSIIYNNEPTDLVLAPTIINENSGIDALVGTLKTIDDDPQDTHTYQLVAGQGDTDNAAFSIDQDQLIAAVDFDFETQSTYEIRVRTTDLYESFFEKELTVTVNDVNEPILRIESNISIPPTALGLSSNFEATVHNDGNADLLLGQINYPDGFSGPAPIITIAPSASQVLTFMFSPLAVKTYSDEIELLSNGGNDVISVTADGVIITSHDAEFDVNDIVRVYPNPSQDLMAIDLTFLNGVEADLKISNLSGREMYRHSRMNQKVVSIDVSNFAKGVYILLVKTEHQLIKKKLMIQR